ncbi:MAG: hypothetical protein FVQ77_11440 [Cytophagales bacterium]|nr:hypothetical protein [Cytophagales bacterium]
MDIQAEKLSVIQRLEQINDISLIQAIKEILDFALKQRNEKDIWNTLTNEQKQSIERGIVQADKGELKSHKEVMKRYKKWL